MKLARRLLLIFTLLMGLLSISYALKTDTKSKLIITSDSYFRNYKTGIDIFVGNVKADQGTTHLTADKLVTKSNPQHEMNIATAYGNATPAHYWTTPNPKDPIMNAYAKIIKFYPATGDVVLQTNVTVKQGENNFTGELVIYNNTDQTITVPSANKSRAKIIYTPDA